jgi:hypothetical protein
MSGRRGGTQSPESPPRRRTNITTEEGNRQRRTIGPSSSFSSRGGWSETCERGTGHQELNSQDVIHWIEGKPAKVCHQTNGAQEGIGDPSPGDMDKGYGQGIMPRATPSRVNPP